MYVYAGQTASVKDSTPHAIQGTEPVLTVFHPEGGSARIMFHPSELEGNFDVIHGR